MPLTAEQANASFGGFAANTISKGKTTRTYSSSLLYSDLSKEPLLMKECSKANVAISISTFNRGAVVLPSIAPDGH